MQSRTNERSHPVSAETFEDFLTTLQAQIDPFALLKDLMGPIPHTWPEAKEAGDKPIWTMKYAPGIFRLYASTVTFRRTKWIETKGAATQQCPEWTDFQAALNSFRIHMEELIRFTIECTREHCKCTA